jgi:site-specific DNA-methyltransferase (adenine-specific)
VQTYKGKHVCEKPAEMLEDMINASSKPGAIVLDCFAGSGSTLIAAQKLGRQFVGIEIDPHWVSIASQALGTAVETPQAPTPQRFPSKRKGKPLDCPQLSLFDVAV